MIEQTEMMVTKWQMHVSEIEVDVKNITNHTTLQVMKKRNAIKKGIACRLTARFAYGNIPVLEFAAEHSYVIDFDEVITQTELANMIRNSFMQFNEKFEFRKLGTILHDQNLVPIDENALDLDTILPLLV